MKSKIKIVTTWVAGGSLALLALGCSSTPINHGEQANPPIQADQIRAINAAQEDAGARAESTLYPQHFDGPALSSLGTSFLDMELKDSHSANPLVIYLSIPNDTYSADRRMAVQRYLSDKGGLKAEQIQFVYGVNPATNYPVEENLANYNRTDSSTGNGGGSSGMTGTSGTGSTAGASDASH